MDEANRSDAQGERTIRSLEEIVKARTEQLGQSVSQNDQLLDCLRQMQSMESLEQVREAIRVCLKKFAPEPMQRLAFGGKAGEPVPEVDPEDLKAIWLLGKRIQANHPGQNVGVGIGPMKAVCKPGANVEAIWYRSTLVWLLSHFAPERLAPWMREGNGFADPVFRTMAAIPVEWIGPGIRDGLPFDVEECFRRLSEH